MNAVAFSLFGTAPIYLHGALRNSQMYPQFFKDWTCVFFVEQESVPADVIAALLAYGADVRLYSRVEYPNGMFARFLIADDPTVERFIVRDVDSRPCAREVAAVHEWIESSLNMHIMRDHPYHAVLALGGLWGATRGTFTNVAKSIKRFPRSRKPYSRDTQYGADQVWLWEEMDRGFLKHPLVHDSCLAHKFGGVPFPPSDDPPERFVGEIFDENEQPNEEHRRVRSDWIRQHAK